MVKRKINTCCTVKNALNVWTHMFHYQKNDIFLNIRYNVNQFSRMHIFWYIGEFSQNLYLINNFSGDIFVSEKFFNYFNSNFFSSWNMNCFNNLSITSFANDLYNFIVGLNWVPDWLGILVTLLIFLLILLKHYNI
jgi:hypothetical protein